MKGREAKRLAARNAVMLSCLVLGACAPTIWDKPGATQMDFKQDSARCRLLARGMNAGDFYAQGSPNFVAGAALGNALGTAANQVATYRDCMMAVGYTPRAPGAETDETAPATSCGWQHPCAAPASPPKAEVTEECRLYRAVVDGRQISEVSLVELTRRCRESLEAQRVR